MKQIYDHSLFLAEFQRLINSKRFATMKIDENDQGMVIHLEKQNYTDETLRREQRLNVPRKTAGILKNTPPATKQEFQALADREGEEDREGSQL